jgi:hypothetical protein
MKHESHIGNIHKGDTVEFSGPDTQSFYGVCVALEFGESQNDYASVTIELTDGTKQIFGTGGHLGNTWTAYDGSHQWFVHNFGRK